MKRAALSDGPDPKKARKTQRFRVERRVAELLRAEARAGRLAVFALAGLRFAAIFFAVPISPPLLRRQITCAEDGITGDSSRQILVSEKSDYRTSAAPKTPSQDADADADRS